MIPQQNGYFVYCHTTPSNRKYVGISSSPYKRWNGGRGYSKNYIFARAIEKYGWDNIKHEILYSDLSLDDARSIEKKLIKEWRLTDKRFGMNLLCGGEGGVSESTRKLMSNSREGNSNCKGRKLSRDTKDKISASLRSYYSTHPCTFAGMHHTETTKNKLRNRLVAEETRQKMKENHCDVKGEKNPSAKPVLQISKDGILVKRYPYAKMACEELKIDLSSVIKCCRGKAKTCGGYVWQYDSAVL